MSVAQGLMLGDSTVDSDVLLEGVTQVTGSGDSLLVGVCALYSETRKC